MNDLRLALRQLLKHSGFAAAVILTLALGVGANTAIFNVVNAILLQPLPYPEAGRLVRIASVNPTLGTLDSRSSGLNILDWQRETKLFEGIAAFQEWDGILTFNGKSETARVNWATPNLLPMLRVRPALGDLLPSGEEPASGIVLPHGLWRSQFAGDPSVIGKWIKEDGEQTRVVGVLPPDTAAPAQGALALDQAFVRLNLPRLNYPRGWQLFNVIGRLKPGVSVEQAQAELSGIAARLEQLYPETNRGWSVKVTGLKTWMVEPIRGQLWIVYGATAIMLLMACLNVSNLLLIRGASRQKELAIRCALGSTRFQLLRQLLSESVILAVAGGLAGLFLAFACQKLLFHFAPQSLGIDSASPFGWPAVASALITSILAALLFGFLPALRLSRGDLSKVLGETSRGATTSKSRHRTLGSLVAGQVAISTMLLVAAGLAVASFKNLARMDPGFAKDNTLFFRVGFVPDRQTFQRLLESISTVPGIESAGASHIELMNDLFANPIRIVIDGKPDLAGASAPTVNFWLATKDYFAAAGIPLVAGRTFETQDEGDNPRVAVINEALAKRYFPNENPLGKIIRVPKDNKELGAPRVVIGVVGSVLQRGLREEAVPILYALYADGSTGSIAVAARTKQDPSGVVPAIRAAVRNVNPELILSRVSTGQDVLARSLSSQRFATQLMFTFAALGALLAAIGLYGVLSYAVSQRAREIGLRIALGARRGNVLKMILRLGMSLALIGAAAGFLGALAVSHALHSLLFQISADDPATFAAIAILLFGVALIACWIPACRATRIDPMMALKND